ncbi:MAG: phosphoenolpyruvate carboxykinase (GTP), partial [Candidatus Omnitrophica bacterium]|nr:phosphoenolpyruvate carboxykinase (GTP) [Candidatus Omnitrophota bacterium]
STPDGTLVIQDVIVNPANSGPKAAIIAASFGLKTRFYGFGSGIERDIFAYLIERQHQAGEVDLLEGACRTKVYLFVPNISDPNQPPRQIPLQTPRQPLNEETGEQLIEYLEEHLPKASQGNEFALFPGQILHNAPVEVILRLIKLAKGKGYKTVVNYRPGLGLPEMKAALSASPTVLQTNLDELIQIGGVEPSVFIRNGRPNINEITNKAAALAKENNIQTMIVTLGRYGAIAVDRETGGIYKALYVRAAKIKQKGDVGIGDALLGGFLVKMSEGSDIREALIYGVASGTATAAKPGIEIETDPEAIQGMVRRMQRQWGERLVTDIDVSSVNVSVALLVKDIDKILLNIAEDRSMEALQYITNPSIQQWVQERAKFLEAGGIEVIKATDEKRILEQAVREGVLIKLADGSYYHRSHLKDTARAEFPTQVGNSAPADAGRFNNWMPEEDARQQLEEKTRGSYNGKKMYVVPFIMFPGSPIERIGFQITDSLYGVANLLQLTRVGDVVVGDEALRKLNTTDPKNILRMWHATGDLDTIKRATEPGKPEDRLFVAFPKSKEVGLFGSAYGGNLLGAKKFGLRLLQYIAYQNVKEAREEGRPIPPNTLVLMEHAALIEFINKKTNDTYRIMLFGPSQSGKSTFATYLPPGELADDWEVQTISDDLVGMWFDEEGYLVGANPEA